MSEGAEIMKRLLLVIALTLPSGAALAERVCVEKVSGVCLRYQERPRAVSPAEAAEQRLGLSPTERRQAQRALAAAGHYDSTVDGRFGPGTRQALRGWQRAQGFDATGYLTADQLTALLSPPEAGRGLKTDAPADAKEPASPTGTKAAPDSFDGEWVADWDERWLMMTVSGRQVKLQMRTTKGQQTTTGEISENGDIGELTLHMGYAAWRTKVVFSGALPNIAARPQKQFAAADLTFRRK